MLSPTPPRFSSPLSRSSPFCALAAVTALFALTGCGKRGSLAEEGVRTQTLHLGNLSEPTDLDPQVITSVQDFNLAMALMEGLTSYDPKTCEPVPGVAERWESSPDGLTWTFHLRKNARWSNGDAVTARDFVFAYQRMLSPAFSAEYAYMLFALVGAEDFVAGKLTDFSQVGVKAPDDTTLVLTLRNPVPYLPGLVAHSSYFPLHPPTILKFGKAEQRGTQWTRPGNFVGNGPFTLQEWKPNQVIRMKKSETYWDAGVVRLNEVNFYPIESAATEEAAFRSGQLHVTTSLPIDKIAVYKNDPKLATLVQQNTSLGTYFYRFNVNKAPLTDVRVRRALSLAIDRSQIVERVTKAGQLPAYTLTPPDTAGYTAPPALRYDPEGAKALLAEAGFPNGAGFPKFEILFNTNEGHRLIAEAIQQMWKRTLNIDVGLYNQEAKVQADTMRSGNYTIARYAWLGDYLDPSTFLELMTTESGNNQTGWSNATYDRLVSTARNTPDQAARFDLYRQAEKLLIEEAPIAPIYFYTRTRLVTPTVKGWSGNLLDLHSLKGVYLEATR